MANSFIDELVGKLTSIDWRSEMNKFSSTIISGAGKFGREVTYYLLAFYYVLKDDVLSPRSKAWVYAALAYILIPTDLLPRKLFGVLGLADDLAVAVYVFKKIKKSITPDIEMRIQRRLDEWFGYEISHQA